MRGVLLLNLGTPDGTPGIGPTDSQVARYLEEFLMDPHVVDIPAILRWLLVHCVILPRRPAKSAEAYRKIWTDRGSPLLVFHDELVARIREELGSEFVIESAMRYGNPSIRSRLEKLRAQGCTEVFVAPLYPQFSLAATQSSIEECRRHAGGLRLSFLPAFYDAPEFLDSFAQVAREAFREFKPDHVFFSFHGLPERQVKRTDLTGRHCLSSGDCCAKIGDANRDCYRAQCYATARGLAERLGLKNEQYTVCFQSRLGRTPWIKPYTDFMYPEAARNGAKRLAVLCPAFVADCLETLEEVGIRGREQFRECGGEDLMLVPSLNASPVWVKGLAQLIRINTK